MFTLIVFLCIVNSWLKKKKLNVIIIFFDNKLNVIKIFIISHIHYMFGKITKQKKNNLYILGEN